MRKKLTAVLLAGLMVAQAGSCVSAYAADTAAGEDSAAMYRLYDTNSGEHFYTASINEWYDLMMSGWVYEGIAWYAWIFRAKKSTCTEF